MTHTIKAFQPKSINLAPQTIEEEVLQNVAMIISTPQFSVPLDRGFGLAQQFLDKPHSVAQTMLVSEVLDALEKYEPRVEVKNVSFMQSEQDTLAGKLIPQVEVNIIDR